MKMICQVLVKFLNIELLDLLDDFSAVLFITIKKE